MRTPPSIGEVKDLSGKRVLLRCDFNVPISDERITDGFRIEKSLPTIDFLRKAGAKIILVSHLENEVNDSLRPVSKYLEDMFPVTFVEDFRADSSKKIFGEMKNGTVVLLENIRRFAGEKKNDAAFAAELASLADIYVNDAFAVSHRPHASIVGVPKKLPHYAGFLILEEIKHLQRAFSPNHPFLFILGGAKFETKLPLVQKFLSLADTLFIGGALANDIFKARGYEVGVSLASEVSIDMSKIIESKKIRVPIDVIVRNNGKVSVKKPDGLSVGDKILDAGPATVDELKKMLNSAKSILWNGPLGEYEGGFKEPTLALAKMITDSGVESLVGGGDTLAAIRELDLFSKFSFVSTGGGAMLDFLANETLPGIEALTDSV